MDVMCLMGNGRGMRIIHCISQKTAASWIRGLGALRMAGLIFSTPNGDGNLSVATCPGSYFLIFYLFLGLVDCGEEKQIKNLNSILHYLIVFEPEKPRKEKRERKSAA